MPQELSSMPETWQLTLDVIKSKAQTLLIKNNGLQDEYHQLLEVEQKFQQAVWDQKNRNEQISRYLKDRHGQTTQKVQIEELARIIKTKGQKEHVLEEQLANLNRKKLELDHKIELLKYSISAKGLYQPNNSPKNVIVKENVLPVADDQLNQLRSQIEQENKQEVLLENELGSLKSGDKAKNLSLDAIDEENLQLESRLERLKAQKARIEQRVSDHQLAHANSQIYEKLKKRKDELETNISVYESRMGQLRDNSLLMMSWTVKKKRMVHEMVQADARNNQIRDKIKVLHEDISVLKDQVSKLEHQLEFAKGKQITP